MEATTLVLMGKTGNGKSATANSIIGRDDFKARWSFGSVTKECKMAQRKWKDNRVINVIDTPGLFDTKATKEFIDKEIVKCIDLAKDGIHGILFVVSVRNRFTEEEANVYDNLQMLFGPRITNYMVVVFTGGDELAKDDVTLEEYLEDCPQCLKVLIRRCNSRTVLFDNKTTSEIKKEKQITKLLEQVDNIIVENENQPYSNELFQKAQGMASQLYYIKDKENAYAEQTKRLNEMMQENIRATEEKVQEITKKLGEQLASAQSARADAESVAEAMKQRSNEEIHRLKEELDQTKNALKTYQEPKRPTKKGSGVCSIL